MYPGKPAAQLGKSYETILGKANNTENVLCQLKKYILTFLKRDGIGLKKNGNILLEVFIMKLSQKALIPLIILHNLNKFWGKLYCFPSQETILKRMKIMCSHYICRRTLNNNLKVMESHQIIRRTRRHRRTKARGMEFRSTLYEITALGYNLLLRAGIVLPGYLRAIQDKLRKAETRKRKPCAIFKGTHDFQRKNSDLMPLFADSG